MRKRKIAVFLTSLVMALSMAIPANAGELDPAHITDGLDVGKYGDVNLDGKINVSDTVLASAYLEGKRKLYGENLARTDINNNFIINVSDVVKIAAHVKGIKPLKDERLERADINGDGKVTVTDVAKLAARVKGVG